MTGRRVALALAAAVALVLAAFAAEVWLPRWRAARERERNELLAPDAPFAAFTVERDGVEWRFAKGDRGTWTITSPALPGPVAADVRAIEDVRRALSGFGGVRTTLADHLGEASDLGAYGVVPRHLAVRWTDGRGRARELVVGNALADGRQVGAVLDAERLVLVPREVREALDRPLGVFREKTVMSFAWDSVERLVIERHRSLPPGASPTVVLERAEGAKGVGKWHVAGETPRDANPTRVGSLVSKLGGLMALGFGAETPGPQDLLAAGLAPPVASVTIERSGAAPLVLDVGDAAGEKVAWAWDRSGPIVMVRTDLRDDLVLADDFYRDNRPVRLPRWLLMDLRVEKGENKTLDLEIQKEGERKWVAVKPAYVELDAADVENLLDLLDQVRCGRFEDEIAESGSSSMRWDFEAPGSLRMQATALLEDGTPLRVDLDATPFKHGDAYYAVRTLDQDAREEICITGIKSFDDFLARARETARRAKETGIVPQ